MFSNAESTKSNARLIYTNQRTISPECTGAVYHALLAVPPIQLRTGSEDLMLGVQRQPSGAKYEEEIE
jgi:hypothetical protein